MSATMNRYEAQTTALACPFCGGAPTIEPWHGGGPQKHAVHCDNVRCWVQPMVTGPRLSSAVERWNVRGAP
jgi:hypothetical protein